ncbi:hypothetical protein [Arthrobacter mobilis]|uniref:Uncharacterized protein n=1 Tax=Arthrobacter mobilis TaxID=2724944 RepID=A0A7X6HF38_9MICC|nr:hypothetical protein [Arthrobacter mobilis]NKX55999.1 hypothetical protein [Arthrobacter mobilis]
MDRATRFLAGAAVAGYLGFIAWLLGRGQPAPVEAGSSPGGKPGPEGPPSDTLLNLDTLLNEVARQEDTVATSGSGIQQRAVLLVGAASIAATLTTGKIMNGWIVGSISMAVAAAVIGIWALMPMKSGAADLNFMFNNIDKATNLEFASALAQVKIPRVRTDMNRLISKARLVRLGAILLAASVALLVVGIIESL